MSPWLKSLHSYGIYLVFHTFNSETEEILVELSSLLGPSHAAELLNECRDLAPVEVSNSETASYSHVLLEWIRNWDQETRHRVLLERMLDRKGRFYCRWLSNNWRFIWIQPSV